MWERAKLQATDALHATMALWVVAFAVIALRVLFSAPERQSVYPIFQRAAQNWVAGERLYHLPQEDPTRPVYRYSPLIAVFFVPFSCLPDKLGAILWRLLNLAIYLGGVIYWVQASGGRKPPVETDSEPGSTGDLRPPLAGLLLLILPLSLGNLNNGQSNPLVLGLVLMSLAAVSTQRFALASWASALVALVKVYPLAVGLLLAVIWPRRFVGWLVLALGVGLLLPFAFQRWDYVAWQYGEWWHYLLHDDRSTMPLWAGYRDLRSLLTAWLVPPDPTVYVVVQLAGAAGCAGVCLTLSRHGWPRSRLLMMLLGLAVAWMTLLGPSSESSTYMLLAPSLAALLLETGCESRPVGLRVLLWASYGLLVLTGVAGWFPGGAVALHALGLHPLAGLLFLSGLVWNERSWWVSYRLSFSDASPKRQSEMGESPCKSLIGLDGSSCR